ncbi:DUF747-domain-containing protein [Ascodesmis nigricans]|uniref:DUF747-domain-containing protein n=1 Tax=Ascodesmis nigricans TaxID=341454 RepID=A0A4S2N7H2_9PEZI|nr:DUF747-domain-containing protein [Ascodesmis nigricans]
MTVEDSRERHEYPTPPPDTEHIDSTTVLGLEIPSGRDDINNGAGNGDKTSTISSIEDSNSPGNSSTTDTKPPDTIPVESKKALKLPPAKLGELLVNSPALFDRQPSSSSPTPSPESATEKDDTKLPVPPPERPLTTRTLSMPPMLWEQAQQKTGKTSPEKPADEHGESNDQRRQSARMALGIQLKDGTQVDGSQLPAQPAPFASPGPSGAFPPLPFHSYLSLALSSNSQTPGEGAGPGLFSPRKTEGNIHGPPPHHPDNSAALALERLQNFFTLPPVLEGAIVFGCFACLDSWLYIFTILPLRFLRGLWVLFAFWREWLWDYFHHYNGNKLRKNQRTTPGQGKDSGRVKKVPKKASDLLPSHKADIMRGVLLFVTVWVLMKLDASKVYHTIRATNGIKLYIIYNMLDFGDKLCAALGQDIFECLFSDKALERRPDGRSKKWRPLGFLALGLAYNILHSIVLFYQVITLNVAVNSFSNALITLLLSVQFVEIKGSVFKRLDKENLFQMTCADIVERFQLWLMLMIIGGRNMVELGIWSLSPGSMGSSLPKSFTFFPSWTGQLMGPFFMVLGSEMLVDWVKHAYITKFNNIRPMVYERYLDIQCKDYYSHAFSFQNVTKRFGLPVLPLACVFIRSTIQTYHQFLATHVPSTFPLSSATSLTPTPTAETSSSSLDTLLRRALSHHSTEASWTDELISMGTMLTFLLASFLIFLSVKLVLGVLLLGFARRRYRGIKLRERMNCAVGGRYGGAYGVVDVGKEERKRIWEGDEKGLKACEGRERKGREAEMKTEMDGLERVKRYDMSSKRIW